MTEDTAAVKGGCMLRPTSDECTRELKQSHVELLGACETAPKWSDITNNRR